MKRILTVIFALSATVLYSAQPPVPPAEGQITIKNRLLARVGDKTISIYDVVKKMDFFLSSYYPEVLQSSSSRFQFYSSNWKFMLEKMIDDELILADSEGKEIKLTEGDVRQMMFDRLGPNIVATLDKLGMTYEEARKMIHDEMIVIRMLGAKVHTKAYQVVGPENVKTAYKEYVAEQDVGEEWEYQVVSIRSPNAALSEKLAHHALMLLTAAKDGPETLAAKMQEMKKPEEPDFSVNVSQLLVANSKTISEAHRKGLEGLQAGMYSQPITQISGSDKTPVQRIFFLKKHGRKDPPTFETVAKNLHNTLLENAASQEEKVYKTKLRQRFSYDNLHIETIPADFQPFGFIST